MEKLSNSQEVPLFENNFTLSNGYYQINRNVLPDIKQKMFEVLVRHSDYLNKFVRGYRKIKDWHSMIHRLEVTNSIGIVPEMIGLIPKCKIMMNVMNSIP